MRKPKAPEANRARILAAADRRVRLARLQGREHGRRSPRAPTPRAALINYYFGSKEKLYLAVLEHVYAEIREAESQLDLDHLPPVDAIRRIVEFTYNYYVEHEGFVRLVVAENQAKGRHLKKSPAMRTLNRPDHRHCSRGVIARGPGRRQRSARDVDPVDVHMAIAALGMFNVTNQYTFGAIFQRDMGAKGDVAGAAHGGRHGPELADPSRS